MHRTPSWILAATALAAVLAGPAAAQDRPAPSEPPAPDASGWSVRAGLGFTLSPSNLLLSLEAPYMVNRSFGVGPLVKFAVSDDWLMIMPTANLQYRFDLRELDNPTLRRLSPFVQGGVGFAWLERDFGGRVGEVDDTGFLLDVGFGFEYQLSRHVYLGNNLMFDILPTEVMGQDFIFSWQFATARIQF